jgi:perosamine synthetase
MDGIDSSYWMVSFLVKNKLQRDNLMENLKKENIETRPFFIPISKMPYYEDSNNPNSLSLSEKGISVPSYHLLEKEDIKNISEKINGFLEEFN